MLSKLRVLAAKVESTVGTAESLSGTEGAFNVFDLKMLPTIEYFERQGQGGFSQLPGTLGKYAATCTFRTQLCGGSSDPSWATVFLPACGFKATSRVYSGLSEAPGSNVKTLTLGGYYNGQKRAMRGCVGTAVVNATVGNVIDINWTFMGAWTAPTDVAILSPTYPSETPLRWANSTFTIGGYAFKPSRFTLDLGNQIMYREDPTASDGSGIHSALITGRKPTGSFDPESVLVATKDVYGIWLARTTAALVNTIGSTNNQVSFGAPALQFTNVQEADRNGLLTDDITFALNRSSADGDELTITFA